MSRAGAALAGALLALAAGCGASDPVAPEGPRGLRADERVSRLFYDCTNSGPYVRDTSDVLPLLVEQLYDGQLEPLRRAKEELATLGEPAAEAVVRFLQEHVDEPLGAPYVQNALDVLASLQAPPVEDALLRSLEHPTSEVRGRALRVLGKRGASPDAYDRLRLHLDVEAVELKPVVAEALHRTDAARAEAEFLDWIAAGSWLGLWPHVLPLLEESDLADSQERAGELYPDAPPATQASLALLAARGGDPNAREFLRAAARDEGSPRRAQALTALARLGEADALGEALRLAPDPGLRAHAARQLGELEPSDAVRDLLRSALDDEAPRVRIAAREVLLARGDEAAAERVLADLLSPSHATVTSAVEQLRGPMAEDPDLAAAALARVRQRAARETGRDFAARKRTLQVLGQVPHPDAARDLLDAVDTIQLEDVDGLRPHRWCLLQAANTGEPGQSVLVQALDAEEDPQRRVDLYWAIAARRNELARERLLDALEEPRVGEVERLYVASLLARLGPAGRMARTLKQVALGVEEPAVRRAFNCLLWRWY